MFNFIENEHNILKLWNEKNALQQMREKTKNSKVVYRTLDGPVTASGPMCIHHVWGRTLKDSMIKYNTLKGRRTHFQNGFDTQGLWVEVEVEKQLGINDKQAIMKYGMDRFTEKCIEFVNHYVKIQTNQSIRVGQIMDWENSYLTNSDHNIECIWNFLRVCHDRGMLVKSYKPMMWCPRCGTSLSEHEMIGSYKELSHKAVFVKVKLNDGRKIVIWTTTPWTLSSNVAIAINPDHDYVAVDVDGEILIVGKDAVKTVITAHIKKAPKIVSEFKGETLVGMTYEPMLDLKIQDFEHKIIPWEDVCATDGTGAVHIAPGCGAEDYNLGLKHNLKQIVPTDENGIFISDFEYLAGTSTTSCQDIIFEKLEKSGKLFYHHDYSHNYPFCWRCKTDVIFKLVDGWDIATDKIRPDLIRAANTVKYHPEFCKSMMLNWLENMGDWNISRRRFYGLPLPIYQSECGHITVVSSREELKSLAVDPTLVDKLPHLHRPYIDEILITCPKCKKPTKRIPDVGDVWLDAGIAPFSTAAKDYRPMQVVIEMKEQIRLWFYAQLFMSVVLTNRAPYENIVGYGTILDEDGKKFSKTGQKKIVLDDAAETFGADATRYLFSSGNPSNDINFGPNLIDEARRKMLSIYNNFVFFKTYYDIDKPNIINHTPKDLIPIDEWMVERINQYIESCDTAYESYKPHEVISATENLVEDLSNFYIRVNRRRFWKNKSDVDKLNAYWVLYNAIKSITIALSPLTPFMCEHVWQTIVKIVEPNESDLVVASDFPKPLTYKSKNRDLIKKVESVQSIISWALSLRARENLKLRQPLETLFIRTPDITAVKLFEQIIRDEVNVHNIKIVTSDEQFNTPYLAVNFKRAGEILKGEVQNLKTALSMLGDSAMLNIVGLFKKSMKITVASFKDLPVDVFTLNHKSKTEFVSVTEGDTTLVLDTVLTENLIEEGNLRELIRTIQTTRQQKGLDITARVEMTIEYKDDGFKTMLEKNKEKICEEVLATNLIIKKGKLNGTIHI